jgi:predicted transposase YbfD/YdcC
VQREFREARQTAETSEKGHGRREHRRLISTTVLNDFLNWPGVQQVCQLTRRTVRGGKETTEVQYAITSVPRALADARQLLQWWRGHWRIENGLHYVRDVTFGEDASRIRSGGAPQILAATRNAAITLLRALRIDNIAAALRENAWKPQRLLAMLGRRTN